MTDLVGQALELTGFADVEVKLKTENTLEHEHVAELNVLLEYPLVLRLALMV